MRLLLSLVLLLAAPVASGQGGEPVTVAILGSSNTEGIIGPSRRDSAWAERLRDHLAETRPGSRVVNYARGGYTTYNIRPSNANPPNGRPAPDPVRNVTQALTVDPDVILISLTSNDANRGYAVAEQLESYRLVIEAAGDAPVFITTTTPRTAFSDNGAATDAEKRRIQAVMKDSTLARYGARAVDFWTGLALADSTLDPHYGSGDGVHFNDAGHRLLFERILASGLLQVATPAETGPDAAFGVRPLRQPGARAVEVRMPVAGPARVEAFDALGRRLAVVLDGPLAAGAHRLTVPDGSGVVLVRLVQGGRRATAVVVR